MKIFRYSSSLFVFLFFLLPLEICAQNVGINNTGAVPDPSAVLDLKASDKGFLVPRLSSAQRNAIASPAEGLLVYQTNGTSGFYFYNGAAWALLNGGGSVSPFLITGDTVSNGNGNYATNDFVFGAPSLDYSGVNNHRNRMFFDKSKGAFRAGSNNNANWDADSLGTSSFAGGQNSRAGGDYSAAFGLSTISNGFAGTAVGMYNDPVVSQQIGITGTTPLFIVGNGNDASNRSNALWVQKDGRVGLGTNTPANRLHVLGKVRIEDGTQADGYVFTSDANGLGSWQPQGNGAGVFVLNSDIISNGNGNYATNDLVFGSPSLEFDGVSDHNYRMFFDKSKGAFRAGFNNGPNWNTDSVGSVSFSAGQNTRATGSTSTAFGFATNASGSFSTAFGSQTTASGGTSMAWGVGSEASGLTSTAFGNGTEASGDYAVAMGLATTASGLYSTAMGNGTTASEGYSVAMGDGTDASGVASFAMGKSTVASGNRATALGLETQATGGQATAMGRYSRAIGFYSTAMGDSTTAAGLSSVAMGDSSIASGASSVAMGKNNVASGNFALAAGSNTSATHSASTALGNRTMASGKASLSGGQFTTASGESSVAIGEESHASAINSFASGKNTTATGDQSTAFGYYSDAVGPQSVAMGKFTHASGENSMAIGNGTIASGENSMAMGDGAIASGLNSMAIGEGIISNLENCLVVGRYNDTVTPSFWDPLFIVGNGSSSSYRGNAMVVDRYGRVGIGENEPSYPLEMGSGAYVTNFGVWTNASDSARKYDIRPLEYGLAEVMALRPSAYRYKIDGSPSIGFVAQDMETVIPEVVDGREGKKGIGYGLLTALLAKAMQEQQAQIERQQEEIELLKSANDKISSEAEGFQTQIESLQTDIAALKTMLRPITDTEKVKQP
jgi:hypothetical protein